MYLEYLSFYSLVSSVHQKCSRGRENPFYLGQRCKNTHGPWPKIKFDSTQLSDQMTHPVMDDRVCDANTLVLYSYNAAITAKFNELWDDLISVNKI